jgi:hypothetical protein
MNTASNNTSYLAGELRGRECPGNPDGVLKIRL